MNNRFEFTDIENFTRFCAELQRQGIAFHGGDAQYGIFFVILTGH